MSHEQRGSHRAPLDTKVKWTLDGKTWRQDRSGDVSSTGLLLRTGEPVDPGRKISVLFQLPNVKYQDPVGAEAEVMRVVRRGERQLGLGLRFLTLRSRSYEVVQEFVQRIMGLENVDGLASKDGGGYTFRMERLAREAEEKKAEKAQAKMEAVENQRRKAEAHAWINRFVKAVLLAVGLVILIKAGGLVMQIIARLQEVSN